MHSAMRPTEIQLAWARRVIGKSDAQSEGAFQLDGEMVDAPLLKRARAYLRVAGELV